MRIRQDKNGRVHIGRWLVTMASIVFVELGSAKMKVRLVEVLMMLIATEGTVCMEPTSYCVEKSQNPNESKFSHL